jgi:hypothetical protein
MTTSPRAFVDPSDVSGVLRDFSSARTGITAFAGGGQGSATALTAAFNRVTTVATAGDSVRLPLATPGATCVVFNRGAASMNVFPATGQSINALSANTALAVAAGNSARFVCVAAGIWDA